MPMGRIAMTVTTPRYYVASTPRENMALYQQEAFRFGFGTPKYLYNPLTRRESIPGPSEWAMVGTYNLNGAFKPTTKRFADLSGPDFHPTPA